MKQKLTLRRILASAVAALAAAAAVWLLCRWVGYDLQLRIGNEPVYEIANDDYTQIIDVPEDGLWQGVPLEAGQTLYGCRLRFSTHGELYRAGMVMVDLCDADGTILREAAGNYANIFDDNFTGFAFGTAYTAAQAETLYLHIYNVVEWEGPLGLWASTGTVGALALTADGIDADATLALQYMTDDTGSWPSDLANGLAPLLAFAAFAAVLLFSLRAPLPLTVAVVGLACGLLFVRVTPALVAPDEYTHLAAAYELASRLGGETPADENGCLLVRESDAPHFGTRSGEIGILAYKAEALARQNEAGGPDALTAVSEAKAGQGSGNYLPQALGIRLARNAGANFYTMLRQARTFNLIFYLLLAVLEKRAGYAFYNQDVYINIIGGLKLDETACDLPVCIALASSLLDLPVDEKTIAIGEVGLGGEVRSVTHLETRLREAQRVGFDTAIVPKHNLKMIDPSQFPGLKLVGVSYLREAINAIKLK